jgi:hypothetical protein
MEASVQKLRDHAKTYAGLVAIEIEKQLGTDGGGECSSTRQKLLLLTKLRDLFMQMSETRYISWKDNKTCGFGISRLLRESFPVAGFGVDLPVDFPPPYSGKGATPMHAGDYWYRYARNSAVINGLEAEATLYQYIMNFCIGLATVMHRIERNKPLEDEVPIQVDSTTKALRDYTYEFRKDLKVKRLCQFCWRPAGSGRGETCCQEHSQLKNPAGYMRAKRHNLQTPEIVRIAFDFGTARIISLDMKSFEVWAAHSLRLMRDDWSAAVSNGIARGFIDSIQGAAYKKLKKADEHKNWDCFFSHLCDAFKVGPCDMPDDPDYLALVLPHAIAEVEAQKTREAGKRKPVGKERVIQLASNISKRGRGWQTRLAEQTGLSRQRINAILKDNNFVA